jgi:hypothetical protein
MRIKLSTDYHDNYDHWFDREGELCFIRSAVQSWSVTRTDMFNAFAKISLNTPKYASVDQFEDDEIIVVYVDENAHCGEGKILLSAKDAKRMNFLAVKAALSKGLTDLSSNAVTSILKSLKDVTGAPEPSQSISHLKASKYIPDFRGVTYRLLNCGDLSCWFRHVSFDDWRSNAGDGDLFELSSGEILFPSFIPENILNPLWAIDFIPQRNDSGVELLAVDFNTAPKIAGTPLAKLASPKTFADSLRQKLMSLRPYGGLYDNNIIDLSIP